MTENEMVGCHHQLNGHAFEQASGDSEGQGSLACCSPWGYKESDRAERLSNDKKQRLHTCKVSAVSPTLQISGAQRV